ncbi:MAG: formate dehydrogenase accessory sulfurtransferase FdhD, partial [Desulfobacteraceae bacterium]
MSSTSQTRSDRVIKCEDGSCFESSVELIGEEPLLIRVDGEPYTVVMRTPGEEMFHAAGVCLGEGIVDFPDDFASVGYCEDIDPNVIEVRLKPERREKVEHILQRRGFVSQTSCGICGKQMIEDIEQELLPVENGFSVDISRVLDCAQKLSENQAIYPRTRGAHAALIFDENLEILAFTEDVGRHNALDKAVGKAFMKKELSRARLLVMSSR